MNIIEFSEIINSEPKIKVLLALKDVNHISTLYMYEQLKHIIDFNDIPPIFQEFIDKKIIEQEGPPGKIYYVQFFKFTKKGTQILEILETIKNI